ncbi:MAG: universal stress protein [Weeksellaceae bacterium]|nr:universal stress protein [Weeksellaceae bacterium]
MKKMLVPVDLSDFSNEIAMAAVDLAKRLDSELLLLHVVSLDVGFIIGDVGFQYLPELEETALQEDAKQLSDLERLVREQGVNCTSIVKQGIPVDTIIEQANLQGADLIVIGSKGHGTLYETFVGSVCRDVIKNSPVPLYVIPNKQREKN